MASTPQETDHPPYIPAWHVAFQNVKHRYFAKQYKQCLLECNELLAASSKVHPIHAAFLHFYAAISYEHIAQPSHHFAETKLENLSKAKNHFRLAADMLPIVGLRDAALPSSESPPQKRSNQSIHSDGVDISLPAKCLESHSIAPGSLAGKSDLSLSHEILTNPTSLPQPKSVKEADSKHLEEHLTTFTDLLQHHIGWIEQLCADTKAARLRRLELFSSNLNQGEDAEMVRKAKRLDKGRATGWRRKRFDPIKTQELARIALQEL